MADDLLFDLSPGDAAQLLGVHEDTLKRWAASGKVRAFRTPGGWWKFRRSDLEELMERGTVEPDEVAG